MEKTLTHCQAIDVEDNSDKRPKLSDDGAWISSAVYYVITRASDPAEAEFCNVAC